jgi:hypothetical protein
MFGRAFWVTIVRDARARFESSVIGTSESGLSGDWPNTNAA